MIQFFEVFSVLCVYSDSKIDQFLTVYRNQSVESNAVEIFCLSPPVFELEGFLIFKFSAVLIYSIMTYLEKVQVSNL